MYENPVENKGGSKRFIFFGIIALIVMIAITLTVILFSQAGTTDEPVVETDAEQVEYDSKGENTGGEAVDIPANEKLDFLKEYLSDEDILYVDNEIYVTVNNYYPNGFNTIIYDLDSVKLRDPGYQLVFDFSTDAKDHTFHMVIQLNSKNEIVSSIIEVD